MTHLAIPPSAETGLGIMMFLSATQRERLGLKGLAEAWYSPNEEGLTSFAEGWVFTRLLCVLLPLPWSNAPSFYIRLPDYRVSTP